MTKLTFLTLLYAFTTTCGFSADKNGHMHRCLGHLRSGEYEVASPYKSKYVLRNAADLSYFIPRDSAHTKQGRELSRDIDLWPASIVIVTNKGVDQLFNILPFGTEVYQALNKLDLNGHFLNILTSNDHMRGEQIKSYSLAHALQNEGNFGPQNHIAVCLLLCPIPEKNNFNHTEINSFVVANSIKTFSIESDSKVEERELEPILSHLNFLASRIYTIGHFGHAKVHATHDQEISIPHAQLHRHDSIGRLQKQSSVGKLQKQSSVGKLHEQLSQRGLRKLSVGELMNEFEEQTYLNSIDQCPGILAPQNSAVGTKLTRQSSINLPRNVSKVSKVSNAGGKPKATVQTIIEERPSDKQTVTSFLGGFFFLSGNKTSGVDPRKVLPTG